VVASDTPFEFHPSNLYGFHYAFVAVQEKVTEEQLYDPSKRLLDNLAPLPKDMANWREYRDFLKTNESVAYSNVIHHIIRVSTRY
jgi:hypothetical protein